MRTSTRKFNGPKYLIAAHEAAFRSEFAKKANNVSVFDHVDDRNFFVEVHGIGYPKVSVNVIYGTNVYLNQNRGLKSFFEEDAKETLLKLFITKTDM